MSPKDYDVEDYSHPQKERRTMISRNENNERVLSTNKIRLVEKFCMEGSKYAFFCPKTDTIYLSTALFYLISEKDKDVVKNLQILSMVDNSNEEKVVNFTNVDDWISYLSDIGFDYRKTLEEQNYSVDNRGFLKTTT